MKKNKVASLTQSIETQAVRAGTTRSQHNEHSEALFLTSSFVFDSAQQAADRFSGDDEGNIYARFTNPSVTMFEQRLATLEGAQSCVATASGMSAILSLCLAVLESGDHVVIASSLFGTSITLFTKYIAKFGVSVSEVSGLGPDDFAQAMTDKTKFIFIETPSNPLTDIYDIAQLADVAHANGAKLVVDNCFCTPALQKPMDFGADIVIHSATKFLDGQGRVIAGAVLGQDDFIEEHIRGFLRTAGPTLSAFNAWVVHKGLETLPLRMQRHSENALAVAQWLSDQSGVVRVHHPGLESHPQHALAMRQQRSGGGILSFELKSKTAAWEVIDNLQLLSVTANLGDTRTTITHNATTTHTRLSDEQRKTARISDGLLRLSVGLEDAQDIISDLSQAMRV